MTERTTTQLLAGVLDLVPTGVPPHPPRRCTALCVPACTGGRPDHDSPIGGLTRAQSPMVPAEPAGAD
jgi:hypothetical protein